MSGISRRTYLAIALSCLLTGASAAWAGTSSAGWWNVAWPHRRLVTADELQPTGLEGHDIAVVTMPTGGKVGPEGDVRVVTPMGAETPSRVLMLGPGDQARVAFALQPGLRRYYVYFGNDDRRGKKELDIRRGVLMEAWQSPGGPAGTLDQARAVFRRADNLLGRDFRDRVFLGHNPFGPGSDVASVFTGWLRCAAAGVYTFCTSSTDASFLLIDDVLVVANGGIHLPQRDVSKQGDIELKAGLHKLTFYHVSGTSGLIAVAAWRPPGADRIRPIPAGAFAPVAEAEPGPMEDYGRKLTIDFLPSHLGETTIGQHYNQRYSFQAFSAGPAGGSIRWQWDFGDGQESELSQVEHVFLTPGPHTVRLAARTYAGALVRENRLEVSRPWDRLVEERSDTLQQHATIVSSYDFSLLKPVEVVHAVRLFKHAQMPNALMAAGDTFCRRKWVPGWALDWIMPDYTEALVADGEADLAVKALQKGLTMTAVPASQARLLVLAGRILLDEKGDWEAALEMFSRAVGLDGPGTAEPVRNARIGMGDLWRLRGDFDKAMEAYEAAGNLPDRGVAAAVRRGDYARYVEDFIRRGEFSEALVHLGRWEDAFPADRLQGYCTLLRVRLHLARNENAAATAQAEALLKVNPASTYAPELLMHAADAYAAIGQEEKALGALKRLADGYAESPLAADAAGKLLKYGPTEDRRRRGFTGGTGL